MITTTLRQFLEYPHRQWVVITLTSLGLLALTWPAVDHYTATQNRQKSLETSLTTTQATISQLSTYQAKVQETQAVLTNLEKKTLSEQSVQPFRNEVVQMVRDSGCQMRRIRLDKPRQREWTRGDNPLEARVDNQSEATPFMLRTQQFGLSVTGSMVEISKLLALMNEQEHLIHCRSFSMQRSSFGDEGVVLELELLLFDLVPKNPDEIAA